MPSKSMSQSLNALPPGTVLRDYVIESELGSGGFSIVYLARHTSKCRPKEISVHGPMYTPLVR